MKVVIAIDSFKGCASSVELAHHIQRGITRVYPYCEIVTCPIADGGEGTVEALASTKGAQMICVPCKGPLGDNVDAFYTILEDKTAVIEMAAASGLPLIPVERRDPRITSSYGTGEMIVDAIQRGSRDFIIGIGGSATNDAGLGMLRCFGFRFFDKTGTEIIYAKDLSSIVRIDQNNVLTQIKECRFRIACDVTNPLYGPNGASYVYGAQKGADTQTIALLDDALKAFAEIVKKENGRDVSSVPGTGAAGGLGFGFLAFLNAKLESGIQIILEQVGLHEKLLGADFVITGEGKIDRQSAMGKVIDGIGTVCQKHHIPCIALAGNCHESADNVHEKGVTSVFSILSSPLSLEEAMNKEMALLLIEKKSEQLFRLISALK